MQKDTLEASDFQFVGPPVWMVATPKYCYFGDVVISSTSNQAVVRIEIRLCVS